MVAHMIMTLKAENIFIDTCQGFLLFFIDHCCLSLASRLVSWLRTSRVEEHSLTRSISTSRNFASSLSTNVYIDL